MISAFLIFGPNMCEGRCEEYLKTVHKDQIIKILEHTEQDKCFSINIDILDLFEADTNLGNSILSDPNESLKTWSRAGLNAQNHFQGQVRTGSVKTNVNCRIYNIPPWPHINRITFPQNEDANKFLQVTGTVVRISSRKLLEFQRQYVCARCKYPVIVECQYDKGNIIKKPTFCPNPEGCAGKHMLCFGELDPKNCKEYQEIKIQEDLSQLGLGATPNNMTVTLEDDLVNICKPGEKVTITGVVTRRWSEFCKGAKIYIELVMRANHVQVNNSSGLHLVISEDVISYIKNFWKSHSHNPLLGRSKIAKSIAPEIYGIDFVKLAMAVILAGGTQFDDNELTTGVETRADPHLLLVGDPGTGKSQLLRFASKIIPRSVLTTGISSTAAGLTVAAFMENGEWQLEAGALVMADGGICCIDEFNSMKEHDKTSIHEAMEQQTISVAKAGMVCQLKTRCSILAACNPKGNVNPSKPLCLNVAMSSPLLSRFDLVLLMRDIVNEGRDRALAEYLLNYNETSSYHEEFWDINKLQEYYAVIRKRRPKLNIEAETILSTYYQLQRKYGSRNKSRTTVRLLESLIRLCQGHAKLMYHEEVDVIDAIFAVVLVDHAIDSESSILHLQIDEGSFLENTQDTYLELFETVLQKLNLPDIYQRDIKLKYGDVIENISQAQASNTESLNVKDRLLDVENYSKSQQNKDLNSLFTFGKQIVTNSAHSSQAITTCQPPAPGTSKTLIANKGQHFFSSDKVENPVDINKDLGFSGQTQEQYPFANSSQTRTKLTMRVFQSHSQSNQQLNLLDIAKNRNHLDLDTDFDFESLNKRKSGLSRDKNLLIGNALSNREKRQKSRSELVEGSARELKGDNIGKNTDRSKQKKSQDLFSISNPTDRTIKEIQPQLECTIVGKPDVTLNSNTLVNFSKDSGFNSFVESQSLVEAPDSSILATSVSPIKTVKNPIKMRSTQERSLLDMAKSRNELDFLDFDFGGLENMKPNKRAEPVATGDEETSASHNNTSSKDISKGDCRKKFRKEVNNEEQTTDYLRGVPSVNDEFLKIEKLIDWDLEESQKLVEEPQGGLINNTCENRKQERELQRVSNMSKKQERKSLVFRFAFQPREQSETSASLPGPIASQTRSNDLVYSTTPSNRDANVDLGLQNVIPETTIVDPSQQTSDSNKIHVNSSPLPKRTFSEQFESIMNTDAEMEEFSLGFNPFERKFCS